MNNLYFVVGTSNFLIFLSYVLDLVSFYGYLLIIENDNKIFG